MRRPASPFNTAEDVFEQRFGCMRSVARPEALTLGHYRASQAAVEAGAVSAAALLLGAATRFGALVGAAAGLLAGTAVDLAPAQVGRQHACVRGLGARVARVSNRSLSLDRSMCAGLECPCPRLEIAPLAVNACLAPRRPAPNPKAPSPPSSTLTPARSGT